MDASSAARRLSLTLAHFPSVCTGNETYLSASYWHVVATTLDALTAAYLYIGAIGCTAPSWRPCGASGAMCRPR